MSLKKAAVILGASLIAMFLQSAVFGTFFPRWLVPNLCLVIVVFLGMTETTPFGAFLAFCVGLLLDLSSGQLIGPWSGACTAVFGFLAQGGKRMFLDSGPTIGFMVFLSSIAGSLVYLFLLSQFRLTWNDLFSVVLFGTAFMTALVSPAVFTLLKRVLSKRQQSRYL